MELRRQEVIMNDSEYLALVGDGHLPKWFPDEPVWDGGRVGKSDAQSRDQG